ncbi:MAG: glycosyl hydrolase, partial [Chloroflexota bacterium]
AGSGAPLLGHGLAGPFLAFFQREGGLATFGYPRTEPFTENGRLMQYTERFLLELAQGQVMTAPLGRLLTAGRAFPTVAPFAGTSTRRYFAGTGHGLSGRFLSYWLSHDGAHLLGAPISEEIRERNGDRSGQTYLLQWFENGRLEYHPELAGTRYQVQVGLLGTQALERRGWLS